MQSRLTVSRKCDVIDPMSMSENPAIMALALVFRRVLVEVNSSSEYGREDIGCEDNSTQGATRYVGDSGHVGLKYTKVQPNCKPIRTAATSVPSQK